MRTQESKKSITRIFLLSLILFFASAFFVYAAFSGPPVSPAVPNSTGAIGVNGTNNLSIGTTTPLATTKLLLQASSTNTSDYALRIHQPDGTPIFVVRNDGKIGIMTSTPSSTLTIQGDLLVTGNITVPNISAKITASNVTPGVFNSSVSTSTGDYAFPAYLAVGTSTTTGIPAGLTLYGGGFLAQGVTGATPVSGAGTRMMWIPAKAAFRAGVVTGTQWDNASVGVESAAFGRNNTASGQDAFAAGNGAFSTGSSSISLGFNTYASHTAAFASGNGSNAFGYVSTAMGQSSNALATGSVAIGTTVTANANQAMALGSTISVTGNYSLGIGLDATARTFAQANSMAIMGGNVGIATTSPDYPLDVEGTIRSTGISPTPTTGAGVELYYSGGTGYVNSINRSSGANTSLYLIGSPITFQSGGNNEMVVNTSSVSIGTTTPAIGNLDINSTLRLIPIPTSLAPTSTATSGMIYYDSTRTAYRCYSQGTWVDGCFTVTGGQTNYVTKWTTSNTLGTSTITDDGTDVIVNLPASSTASFTLSNGAFVAAGTAGGVPLLGAGTRLMWVPSLAAFRAGTVDSTQWDSPGFYSAAFGAYTRAGTYAFAAGSANDALGSYSAVFGSNNDVLGQYALAYGSGNIVNTNYAFAGGLNSTASGTAAVALGLNNRASGIASFAVGSSTVASGDYSFAAGANTTASGASSVALGFGSIVTGTYGFAAGNQNSVGNGSGGVAFGITNTINNLSDWSFAIGGNNNISGDYAIAGGSDNVVSNNAAAAFGGSNNINTKGNYAIALGFNNLVQATSAVAIGSGNIITSVANTGIALGDTNSVSGARSIAMGQAMTVSGQNSVGINLGASSPGSLTQNNSMAIMSGNVGIGTLVPSAPLDVVTTGSGVGTAAVRLRDSTGAGGVDLIVVLGDGTTRDGTTVCRTLRNITNSVCLAQWSSLGANLACNATIANQRVLCADFGQ